MIDLKGQFFFYLAAVLCFLVAAVGEGWKYGKRTRAGLPALVVTLPLGLALWLFPLMWNTGYRAFR
ncbi:hypothetical protein [Aquihabitans sp. McL0605]|uniref:hypothetical protein n=1 Tax=Aquihabitans sp. McL0605 TaxID=3415671 RepID=UPI003CEFD3B7